MEPSKKAKSIKEGKYRHFKGKDCWVMGVARHSETKEELLIYQELHDDSLWIRPLDMFLEEVTAGDGRRVPRFEYLGE